ncbi:TonB-system energizer ExbB [Helicobacter kayseriensis]|uniref:TonB-system energizer ExbB n=1 Tax=Helicobacter kayseriensis TaxID=2905877 RepID=UPI001E2E4719|nr:TonB-system energizer ExbB [Helicobacter kayseriensis]MCE3047011.1 TonB-system energizer ExbB [Helicobacter kayseriensis]MCE3048329.1 TonB-system energizer ExbB [Helicobacter kayseriensis]
MDFLRLYLDCIIFSILGFMGFVAIWLSVERIIFFSKIKLEDFKCFHDLEEALTKHMTTLYIIYSNAPYIGLLGTVGGIIVTFYGMSEGGGVDAKKIMGDLSLALEATGAGLLVAIPVLVVYNALLRKIDVLLNRYRAKHEA